MKSDWETSRRVVVCPVRETPPHQTTNKLKTKKKQFNSTRLSTHGHNDYHVSKFVRACTTIRSTTESIRMRRTSNKRLSSSWRACRATTADRTRYRRAPRGSSRLRLHAWQQARYLLVLLVDALLALAHVAARCRARCAWCSRGARSSRRLSSGQLASSSPSMAAADSSACSLSSRALCWRVGADRCYCTSCRAGKCQAGRPVADIALVQTSTRLHSACTSERRSRRVDALQVAFAAAAAAAVAVVVAVGRRRMKKQVISKNVVVVDWSSSRYRLLSSELLLLLLLLLLVVVVVPRETWASS